MSVRATEAGTGAGAGARAEGDLRFTALRDAVRAGMARYHVPGVALGVIDGDAEHVAGFGVTNAEQPVPVDGDTLFPIASITKTVVATAVMRLVERGQLELDRPVRRYLPELRLRDAKSSDQLTMLHLLTGVTRSPGWSGRRVGAVREPPLRAVRGPTRSGTTGYTRPRVK